MKFCGGGGHGTPYNGPRDCHHGRWELRIIHQRVPRRAGLVVIFLAWIALAAFTSVAAADGLVVIEVAEPSAAHLAGIAEGDVLLSWVRGTAPPGNPEPARGTFRSPFDVALVELEQGPRGPVELVVRGEAGTRTVILPHDDWGIVAGPHLGVDAGALLDEAVQRLASDDPEGASPSATALAALLADSAGPAAAAWAHAELARRAAASRQFDIALFQLDQAMAALGTGGSPALQGELHERRCRVLVSADRFEEAQQACELSLTARQQEPGKQLAIAMSLHRLGIVAWYRGDMGVATERFAALLEIRREHAAGSLILATSIMNRGLVSAIAERESYYLEALEIRQRVDPDSMATALLWHNLGNLRRSLGAYQEAVTAFSRASGIHQRLAPAGPEAALTMVAMGDVQNQSGRLDAAEGSYYRALAIQEALAPAGFDVSSTYLSLGVVYGRRGSYRIAQQYFERALKIREKIAPDSQHVVATLNSLGINARKLGDDVTAEFYYRRVLKIQNDGEAWINLGVIALDAGDLAAAERSLAKAREILGEQSPRGLYMALVQANLSLLRSRQGRPDEAVVAALLAVELYEHISPGSLDHALAERALARGHVRGGHTDLAQAAYVRAIDVLDTQRSTLGGSFESRSRWSAQPDEIYNETIDFLMQGGHHRLAFEVLERSRARTLLEVMAGRDLNLGAEVPPALEAERRALKIRHDEVLGWLARQPGESDKDLAVARADLDEVRRQLDANLERIRVATPRVAELRSPRPVDLAAAQTARDPGTVILAYSAGPDRTYLFVLGPDAEDFRAITIEMGKSALAQQVASFRELLLTARGARRRALVARRAADLGRLLLTPASTEIHRAERILVIPDGPLHTLPFAALGFPGEDGDRFLVESKPLYLAASVSVFAATKERRRKISAVRLVAFGDAVFGGKSTDPHTTTRGRSGILQDPASLAPLPHSRAEVEALGALYGDSATLWLGAQATEAQALAIGTDATLIHFATHGLVDHHLPLESALALSQASAGESGNGLLHAWEIIESMRLDADLVTLSACESALGETISGEGILGLTRAFQYAGARSVMASLWSVTDRSTAALMARIYTNLKAGMEKDVALRAAQLALLNEPVTPPGSSESIDASAPYSWAAFQLYGDYR